MDCLLAEAALESLLREEHWAGCQQWNLPQIPCFLPPLLSPGSILVLLTYLALLGCRPRQNAGRLPQAPPQQRSLLNYWVSDSQCGGP